MILVSTADRICEELLREDIKDIAILVHRISWELEDGDDPSPEHMQQIVIGVLDYLLGYGAVLSRRNVNSKHLIDGAAHALQVWFAKYNEDFPVPIE